MPLEPCEYADEPTEDVSLNDMERVSLCEVLDRVLNKGVVVGGHVTISVADVDLLYLGLQLVLTSMETARQSIQKSNWGMGSAIDL
jgi:gas vesicle structural protein